MFGAWVVMNPQRMQTFLGVLLTTIVIVTIDIFPPFHMLQHQPHLVANFGLLLVKGALSLLPFRHLPVQYQRQLHRSSTTVHHHGNVPELASPRRLAVGCNCMGSQKFLEAIQKRVNGRVVCGTPPQLDKYVSCDKIRLISNSSTTIVQRKKSTDDSAYVYSRDANLTLKAPFRIVQIGKPRSASTFQLELLRIIVSMKSKMVDSGIMPSVRKAFIDHTRHKYLTILLPTTFN